MKKKVPKKLARSSVTATYGRELTGMRGLKGRAEACASCCVSSSSRVRRSERFEVRRFGCASWRDESEEDGRSPDVKVKVGSRSQQGGEDGNRIVRRSPEVSRPLFP